MKLRLTNCGLAVGLFASLLLTACVDDKYDLDNIDTTSRITVNDLTIPVNIDPITLGDVIKIDGDSKIQSVNINGQEFYALIQKGGFESQDVSVKGIKVAHSPISQTRDPLSRLASGAESKVRKAPAGEFVYSIVEIGNQFSYNALNVDEAIVSIDAIKTETFNFTLSLTVEDQANSIASMTFEDLQIKSPKGLIATTDAGTYDPETGIWSIPSKEVTGNKASVTLTTTGMDAKTAGLSIADDRSLDFDSQFVIESGYVSVVPSGSTPSDQVVLVIDYELSDFEITAFSGQIHYELEGLNISPISLADVPKFLKGDQSRIEIQNPQIFLQMNNPLATVPLEYQTGLNLSALRPGQPTLEFPLSNPVVVTAGSSTTAMQNFVLSPYNRDLCTPADFAEGLKWLQFPNLGSLLTTPAGWENSGLPESIDVTLVNPGLPTQSVTDFALPANFNKVKGNYEIIAPLALNDGSYIYYTDVRSGWNDEDVDNITVTALELTAHAVNNVPAEVQLTVYPIDKNGNVIDAEFASNTLAASSASDLVIRLTGEIQHLDGVRIEALLRSNGGKDALSGSQTLSLTDIRAKVSGYYDKEF